MSLSGKAIIKQGIVASAIALALLASPTASMAQERPLFISLGGVTKAPIGWI